MVDNIKSVTKDTSGNLTESELQVVTACYWLKNGIMSLYDGEDLAKWLQEHIDGVDSIFGADDRVYIRGKTPEFNKELLEFVIKNDIGDEVRWKQCKGSDRWWLYIWWD